MLKVMIFWVVLVMSSPFVVMMGADQYQQSGWLAIGDYNFDVYDGLYRSFYFFIVTFPVIAAAYFGRPRLVAFDRLQIKFNLRIGDREILLMIAFCLIAFYFDLGITGVETDTGIFKLSGITHYIRNYLFLFFVAVYIFSSEKPPYLYVVGYAIVAGLTAGSRFAGAAPLVLLMMRNLLDYNWRFFNKYNMVILAALFLCFSLITTSRVILLAEDYSFSNIIGVLSLVDTDEIDFIYQGFAQLFLRIGIGRDVILSYEVAASGACGDLYGLFLKFGSCPNPPLDFYGLQLDSDRFYLAPPMLSSLFVASNEFLTKLVISLCYSFVVFLMCCTTDILRKIPFGGMFTQPAYFLIVVFVTIGPMYYAWILTCAIIVVTFFYAAIWKPMKIHVVKETNRLTD